MLARWRHSTACTNRRLTALSRNTIRQSLRVESIKLRFQVPERPDRLDPMENVWQSLCTNWSSNTVFDGIKHLINVAEIYTQLTMMLGHEIFDPETSRRVLVDHAFIVAGGEITKQARNWIGNKLDASKRSQVMFMDRDDILNLFVVTNLPLPKGALPPTSSWDMEDVSF